MPVIGEFVLCRLTMLPFCATRFLQEVDGTEEDLRPTRNAVSAALSGKIDPHN